MPVVLPEDRTPSWRMARIATVFAGNCADIGGVDEWDLYVRLLFYCGDFQDEDFAEHVFRLFDGSCSTLPNARLANAVVTKLRTAEANYGPLGTSCWNPQCERRCWLKLPKAIAEGVKDLNVDKRVKMLDREMLEEVGLGKAVEWARLTRPSDKFKKCSQCMFVSYCSERCQKKDWKRHKHFCKNVTNQRTSLLPKGGSYDDMRVSFSVGGVYEFCLWNHLAEQLVKDDLQAMPSLRPNRDGSVRRIHRPLKDFNDERLEDHLGAKEVARLVQKRRLATYDLRGSSTSSSSAVPPPSAGYSTSGVPPPPAPYHRSEFSFQDVSEDPHPSPSDGQPRFVQPPGAPCQGRSLTGRRSSGSPTVFQLELRYD